MGWRERPCQRWRELTQEEMQSRTGPMPFILAKDDLGGIPPEAQAALRAGKAIWTDVLPGPVMLAHGLPRYYPKEES